MDLFDEIDYLAIDPVAASPIESDDERMRARKRQRKRHRKFVVTLAVAVTAVVLASELPRKAPNSREFGQRRLGALHAVHNFTDEFFQRCFRLRRTEFYHLLDLLEPLIGKNEQMAALSSGSAISAEIRLLVTLRMLAGANYLDMYWYGVHVNHVHRILHETCVAINTVLDSIQFPANDTQKLYDMAEEWAHIQRDRYGVEMTPGLLMAGDGIVFEIKQPTSSADCNPNIYYNRKGFFGLVAQVFCDAYCRIRLFDLRWPGATSDITAYSQTKIYRMIRDGKFPEWAWLAMDSIYQSCGEHHVTPFSRVELDKARDSDYERFLKMVVFNHVFCGQRVTIERAFGQLVRRFGILWKRIDLDLDHVPTIILTCAKLHNVCVERWIAEHCPGFPHAYGPDILEHVDIPGATGNESDDIIFARLKAKYDHIEAMIASRQCDAREEFMNAMWEILHIDDEDDTLYHIY